MPRLSEVLVPRDRYFDLFEEAARNVLRAAELLDQMLTTYPDHGELNREILICEQEGDRITHDIIRRLNETFDADRPRGHPRARLRLDDIVDYTEEVADFLGLYKIEAPMDQSLQMSAVLRDAAGSLVEAMSRLRGFKDMSHYIIEMHRLENDGDRIVRGRSPRSSTRASTR